MKLGSRTSKLGSRWAKLGSIASTALMDGPVHGSQSEVYLTIDSVATDVSGILTTAKLRRLSEPESIAGLSSTDDEFCLLPEAAAFDFSGFFDADLDIGEDIEAAGGFDFYPYGNRAGGIKYSGTGAVLAKLDTENGTDKPVTIEGTLTVSGAPSREVV